MREHDDDGRHAAAGQQSGAAGRARRGQRAFVGDARRVAIARIVVVVRRHAPVGGTGLRAAGMPDRRRLPRSRDERPGQDGLPAADRVRQLEPACACNAQSPATRRVANAKRERIERVRVGESLAPKLRQEAPAIAQGCALRLITGDPCQLPEIVRKLGARSGQERANRSDGHARLRAARPRGSRARADRGLYWAANGA